MNDLAIIQSICRHIEGVYQDCEILGERLIQSGEFELGRSLIANGLIHDNSKFYGIEYELLSKPAETPEDQMKLALAVKQHNTTNKHHPEFWGKIQKMPDLFLAEMVCDWHTRSKEFGTSLLDWINGDAMKRFNFTKDDEVYTRIMRFVNMLLQPAFKPVNKV